MNKHTLCPCESNKSYINCCEPFHKGVVAPSAELLMRSRYSAYTLMLETYLLSTWHPETRPVKLSLSNDVKRKWLGLSVKQVKNMHANMATVEFVARYKDGNSKAERLHEISRFILLDRWYYIDGSFVS